VGLAEPATPYLPSLEGVHVLVVDDDDDAREIMRSTLGYFGALVVAAPSAKKAMDAASNVRPDVIVSDLAMPQQDGLALIREVRQIPWLRRTPAIAVTAYGHWYRTSTVLGAGFNVVMKKPLNPPDLVRAVATLTRPA
jgi:CheY-like chemotaxis protein